MEPLTTCRKECCMCGDSGIPSELFHCKVCKYRQQHRYCSNIYPKAESYKVCNWCLHQDDKNDKSHNSSSSSTSNGINNIKVKDKKIIRNKNKDPLFRSKSSNISLMQPNSSIKSTSKRIITTSPQEKLRRTRSENVSQSVNNGVTKRIFKKMKVRRYKFLDEVLS